MFNEFLDHGAVSKRVTSVPELELGRWNTLLDINGPGLITHIWMTFPPTDDMLGRRNLLRMYWDDETEPSVEAPVSDFFGVPWGMTGCTDDGTFHLASKYLVVTARNGLNCYFPMPFAKRARIEVFPEQLNSGAGIYFQADYCQFAHGLPDRFVDKKFHAQFRFENPCENYGRNYLFLDAEGEGALIGLTLAVEMNEPQPDAWCHGGGDSIFIDGESNSSVLHGIGAEDFFGHSWGVRPFGSELLGTSFYNEKRLAVYRFFENDAPLFRTSLRGVIGALGNRYSSVAYWYQTEPHKAFFQTPNAHLRMPDSIARYGQYDIESNEWPTWQLLAPLPCDPEHPFDDVTPPYPPLQGEDTLEYIAEGEPSLPDGEKMTVRWTEQVAYRNFVDFNVAARPAVKTIRLLTGVAGYALQYVDSPDDADATFTIGFDDEVCVRVNDTIALRSTHESDYSEENFTARLKKGRNRILVKLSNTDNSTWRLWAFCFRRSV